MGCGISEAAEAITTLLVLTTSLTPFEVVATTAIAYSFPGSIPGMLTLLL